MCIFQLIRFDRVCSHVEDFNARNACLTVKLLKQDYRYHKLREAKTNRHYPEITNCETFLPRKLIIFNKHIVKC